MRCAASEGRRPGSVYTASGAEPVAPRVRAARRDGPTALPAGPTLSPVRALADLEGFEGPRKAVALLDQRVKLP